MGLCGFCAGATGLRGERARPDGPAMSLPLERGGPLAAWLGRPPSVGRAATLARA